MHFRSRFLHTVYACLLIALAVLGVNGKAQGQMTVVVQDDVSTPTVAPLILPTLTPTPAWTGIRESAEPTLSTESLSTHFSDGRYVVQEGDTLWSVALEIGVDLDVMPCLISPHYRTEMPLVIGETILAPTGRILCHEVQSGETVESIALDYGVDVAQIINDAWNELSEIDIVDHSLEPGRYVRSLRGVTENQVSGFLGYMLGRPAGEPPSLAYRMGGPIRVMKQDVAPKDWPYGSGYFEWPTYGWISQGYRNDHRAVDIAAAAGTIVTAADRGVVLRAGWNNQGYGNFVVIDHNIDYVTLYAHLNEIFVEEGEIVAKGQVIGNVGSTGNSTGAHLHFEVRDFGSRINPLEVLVH